VITSKVRTPLLLILAVAELTNGAFAQVGKSAGKGRGFGPFTNRTFEIISFLRILVVSLVITCFVKVGYT